MHSFTCYRIKIPFPLQWGAPTFNAGQSFGMVAAVLVSLVEVMPLVTYSTALQEGSFAFGITNDSTNVKNVPL
jgi:hypothetical protein